MTLAGQLAASTRYSSIRVAVGVWLSRRDRPLEVEHRDLISASASWMRETGVGEPARDRGGVRRGCKLAR